MNTALEKVPRTYDGIQRPSENIFLGQFNIILFLQSPKIRPTFHNRRREVDGET